MGDLASSKAPPFAPESSLSPDGTVCSLKNSQRETDHKTILGGELPTNRFCGLVHPGYKWEKWGQCPLITRVN